MVLVLNFLKTLHTVYPSWLHQLTFPATLCEGSLFSTSSPTLTISCLFGNNHSNRFKVVLYCGLNLRFPDDVMWGTFHVPVGHLCIFFGKCLFRSVLLKSTERINVGLVFDSRMRFHLPRFSAGPGVSGACSGSPAVRPARHSGSRCRL